MVEGCSVEVSNDWLIELVQPNFKILSKMYCEQIKPDTNSVGLSPLEDSSVFLKICTPSLLLEGCPAKVLN